MTARAKRAASPCASAAFSNDRGPPARRTRCQAANKGAGLVRRAPRLRVPGLARQHAEIDADLPERLLVFSARVLAENELGIASTVKPAIMLYLVFELARRPAGVAESKNGALWSLPARDGLENIERCGQADAFVDRQRRILDEEVAGMQHESALGID